MQVCFWGTRGSLAKPGPATARYGGNTSCVEVISDSGTLVVLDCGTGAHALGQEIVGRDDVRHGHILISHTHWDHIQGIPFFAPLFAKGDTWEIYGPKGLSQSLRETLAGQMEHTYFPISLDQLGARTVYHDLVEGVFHVGDIKITTRYLNHPALTLGYRLEADGVSVVYCCDHEPIFPGLASGDQEITGHDRRHLAFLESADLVIHDAQYTASEFPEKIGWGHSPAEYVVRVCSDAGVKRVFLTHHDPTRDDAAVDRVVEDMKSRVRRTGCTLEVAAAAEGQRVRLSGEPGLEVGEAKDRFLAQTAIDDSTARLPVAMYVVDEEMNELLSEAVQLEGLNVRAADSEAELLALIPRAPLSLVVVEHCPPQLDGIRIARAIRNAASPESVQVPIAIVAAGEHPEIRESDIPTDCLFKSFTLSYARTRVRAWALRAACRWVRAQLPPDESRRLAALHDLNILDTAPEERFDRLTRIAAAALDVPIALVSLVDADRQWFKSCFGLDGTETSRDVAFCSHVVHLRDDLIVPDTLQDDRFAENPLVVDEPRIRFYAGAPLILDDGSCVGTFCLVDTRPRQLAEAEVELLHDLRDLAVAELRRQKT